MRFSPRQFGPRRVAATLLLLGAVGLSGQPAPPPRVDLGPPGHNCRFWGMVGHGYTPATLDDQLRGTGYSTLRILGGINRDGWGFASFPSDTALQRVLGAPLVRRGRPGADNPPDPNFDVAVDEIQRMRPRAVLGHVRTGTTGHWGIPDPHPFLHGEFAFAHNGGVDTRLLDDLFAADDPTYLERFPAEYVRGNIDSEIYFLWLMCHRESHPELSTTEAIREAVALLWPRANGARLNFVMTQGDTLYALRCSGYDISDPVRYYPDDVLGSPFWIAASQPMGTENERWSEIPPATLAVFVPGQSPSFHPIETPAPAVLSFRGIRVRGADADGDGRVARFTVTAFPEVSYGNRLVAIRVERRAPGGTIVLGESAPLDLRSGRADSLVVAVEVAPPDLAPESWSLGVVLIDPESPAAPLAEAGPESDLSWGLAGLGVEGSARDTLVTPPQPVPERIGRPWPNPARGAVAIPVRTSDATGGFSCEVRHAWGTLVFRGDNLRPAGDPPAISWDGRDRDGRPAAAGVYFCRVVGGGLVTETKLTVLR